MANFNPLMPTVAMDTTITHPVPDRVKPSFVICDIRALWRSGIGCFIAVPMWKQWALQGKIKIMGILTCNIAHIK